MTETATPETKPRLVPLKAQCAAGHDVVSKALGVRGVAPEYVEAAQALLKTFDWLMANEDAIKLAARCQKHNDILEAIELVLVAKKEFPDATLSVKEER